MVGAMSRMKRSSSTIHPAPTTTSPILSLSAMENAVLIECTPKRYNLDEDIKTLEKLKEKKEVHSKIPSLINICIRPGHCCRRRNWQ